MYLARKYSLGTVLTWSTQPSEGLASCSAKRVPSFLSYFKTVSIGPVPGTEPAISRCAINDVPTEQNLPRL